MKYRITYEQGILKLYDKHECVNYSVIVRIDKNGNPTLRKREDR